LVLDGAMGTRIQEANLSAEDFGGHSLEGCNENLVLTRPDLIQKIHEDYFAAGADIVETNSFGGICYVLAEYGLSEKTREINRQAAAIAKRAAAVYLTPERQRFVAGSLGPGTKTITLAGGISFDEVSTAYHEAALGLIEGGADLILLETQQDTLNVKAELIGLERAFKTIGRELPIIVSVSIESSQTMLAGQTIEALYDSLSHLDLLAIGLNCATGPEFMSDHLRTLSQISRFPIICYPNAGLPDEHGHYHESPDKMAAILDRFLSHGWLNIIGGCCGTTPEHIERLAEVARRHSPRHPEDRPLPRVAVSGLESLVFNPEERPVVVGERTNVIGSRFFKDLISQERHDEASEIGRAQAKSGAHVLDVCLANPDREEIPDMSRFLEILTKKVKLPIMIDSTDAAVIEAALKLTPGRSIINSMNLEDGEERFEQIVPMIRRYGAAVVVGTIDEDKTHGMAVTRARKLQIARRSRDLLTGKYGLNEEDLIFDPLVFPAATGDKNYWASAVETIEGVRLIKQEMPKCRTILGISNVSFGLPAPGREVLNAVFLHLCVEAGLDMAIVNAEKLARYATLDEEEKNLALRILSWKGPNDPAYPPGYDAVADFAARFQKPRENSKTQEQKLKLPVEERLARNIVDGSKVGLADDLSEMLKNNSPLGIINGPLMKGMDEVGKLFAANRMIVAEVLQSAEVMKAAVSYLEPHMDQSQIVSRGRIILATVKGDVHDIGKNLVHIIFKNNGYEVIDLGIRVSPETLIEAIRAKPPDLIGLSGLLVKSTQQMAATVEDFTDVGIKIPILAGGAALSPKFVASKIAPKYAAPVFYAKDAMSGLDTANRWQDASLREALLLKNQEIQAHLVQMNGAPIDKPVLSTPVKAALALNQDHNIPIPPDLDLHVLPNFPLEEIFQYINPIMLYGKHLGLRQTENKIKEKDPKALELLRKVADIQAEVVSKKQMSAKAVYRFYPADSEGETLSLYSDDHRKLAIENFAFPRQNSGDRLCLSDFAASKSSGKKDYIALFVVTCGPGIRELSEFYRDKGEYFKSHALQALAIESAEAFAELLHEKIRAQWGIGDPSTMTIKEKFQARYRGLRASFGYPACPRLEDQEKLFQLLDVEKSIDVKLTEGFMMEPEASVSAIVFHHPQARYFAVAADAA